MKKYLAAVAAVLVAGITTAGSVTWSCDGISNGSGIIEGGIAYLFAGDSTAGVADAIQAGTLDYGTALASATTDEYGYFKQTKIGSYASQDVSLYMIVFDTASVTKDSNFVVSGVMTQSFGTTGNKTFAFTDDSAIKAKSWTPVNPTPVPEPCSVALLALGLAAFGLKRKVA